MEHAEPMHPGVALSSPLARPSCTEVLHDPAGADGHPRPLSRLRWLLRQERSDLMALLVYTLITGTLALAIPLSVQALVNTIAQGIFLQPLFVLAAIVLVFGLVVSGLRLVQLALVEKLQQRVFARIALHLAMSLPRLRGSALADVYVPELVNRFFDVITIQKALAKLLLDGMTVALTALGGLALMAFYSYWLLGFDLAVIAFTALILFGLGRGGLRSSLKESKEKYRVAGWLEELARCHRSMKINGDKPYAARRADHLISGYIEARRGHFRILFRQAMASYVFQAFAMAGVLAIGGWLVISGQLTLGQLVAAELVIVGVLASIEKIVQQTEHFFDLLTGLDKVGHITDLPTERPGGAALPASSAGAHVQLRGVRFAYGTGREALAGVDLELTPGSRTTLVGASGAGKSTLAAILCGLEEPAHGTVIIDGVELRDADLDSLRLAVAVVDDNDELFSGTIEDNIAVGRPHVTRDDIRRALQIACLDEELAALPNGLKTEVVSGGHNLSRGQRQRILIARAVADRPRLLILDEAFTGVEERTRQRILDGLFDPLNSWTILSITHLDEVVVRNQHAHVLAEGRVLESGPTRDLASRGESEFARLFPFLCRAANVHFTPHHELPGGKS